MSDPLAIIVTIPTSERENTMDTTTEISRLLNTVNDLEALDAIYDAWKTRRKVIVALTALTNVSNIVKGDTVTLKGLSPKYLNGITCEVTKVNDKTVVVRMPFTTGKFRQGQELTIPAAAVIV